MMAVLGVAAICTDVSRTARSELMGDFDVNRLAISDWTSSCRDLPPRPIENHTFDYNYRDFATRLSGYQH